MKYALVNGEKEEATKGAKGLCPSCGSELIAKCGEIKINHWAHSGNRNCDPWWENETEWHRSWKNNFPKEWQEVTHTDENSGEKHIADVKTDGDWVLEFQYSLIKPEERRSRNAFYGKLVWVVNGVRRKRDIPQLERAFANSRILNKNFEKNKNPIQIIEVNDPSQCRLLEEWHGSDSLIFFDFQKDDGPKQSILWFLFPTKTKHAYLTRISREDFIELHNANRFNDFVKNIVMPDMEILRNGVQSAPVKQTMVQNSRPSGFQRYLARRRRNPRL